MINVIEIDSTPAGHQDSKLLFPAIFPVVMLAALAAGTLLLRKSQSKLGLPSEQRLAVGLAAFIGAMIGAKLPFLAYDWEGFLSGAAWFASGKTILCGMVGAYFAVEVAKWTLGIRTKTGDSFVVPVAVTIAIGRLACLSAGCCYGVASTAPWALRCSWADDELRHPTQIYEAIFHLLMAGLMAYLLRRGVWRGQLAKFYILAYLMYRFATEFIRPEAKIAFHLTAYQWFAVAMVPVFAGLWWWDAVHAPAKSETQTG